MSIDKACGILSFFTGLELSKSQADSLLSQLASDWQIEYDAIAELVATAAILYVDETGWKVGKRSCYTWIFSTLSTVLFKCGVGRGKVVLTDVLGEQFGGIGVTDDYNAYHSQFTLGSVLSEINHWLETGESVFREELATIHAATAVPSVAPT